jgi:hypothetical protein
MLNQPLFTQEIFQDTSTFTPVDAPFTGLIASDAVWIDYDNDGDLDVIISGWTDSNYVSKIYRNDSGTFVDIFASIIQLGSERGISWGDYDNDGDFDLAISGRIDVGGDQPVTKIYRNDDGVFTDINAPLMALNGGSVSWVDYNSDGRLDLLICGSPDGGSTFYTRLYRNDDTTFTDVNAGFPGVWGDANGWGDFDNDGDPDLLVIGYGDLGVTTRLFRNDSGVFVDTHAPFQDVNSAGAVWFDYDNDGDLDLVLTGAAPGDVPFSTIYRNDGNGQFTDIHPALDQLMVSAVAVGDYDNDGDLDLAISGCKEFTHGTTPTTRIYRNDGGSFVDIGAALTGTWFGSLAWGDYNNDGKLDLIVTGGTVGRPDISFLGPFYSITRIYQNNSDLANTRPSTPDISSSSQSGNQIILSWDPATDNQTPAGALTYNVRVGSVPGGSDIVSPSSNITTGYRRFPRRGNRSGARTLTLKDPSPGRYYWSVQSVDNGYSGSPFSTEQIVNPPSSRNWEMISLPFNYSDRHKSILFPAAASNAFAFSASSGYTIQDVLEYGGGYWIKLPTGTSSLPAPLSEGNMTSVTISVTRGWNMIGSVSQTIPVGQVTSEPPGMITSRFFGYHDGYATSDVIEPGKGYWVKASGDGTLTLSSSSNAGMADRIQIVPTDELPPSPPAGDNIMPRRLPTEYSLDQNFPNPFNPVTEIRYSVIANSRVTLQVYNVLGKQVALLVDEQKNPGTYIVSWNASALPSGIYFYKLQAGGFSDVKKLALIK